MVIKKKNTSHGKTIIFLVEEYWQGYCRDLWSLFIAFGVVDNEIDSQYQSDRSILCSYSLRPFHFYAQ